MLATKPISTTLTLIFITIFWGLLAALLHPDWRSGHVGLRFGLGPRLFAISLNRRQYSFHLIPTGVLVQMSRMPPLRAILLPALALLIIAVGTIVLAICAAPYGNGRWLLELRRDSALGPAFAEIRPGTILTRINGRQVWSPNEVSEALIPGDLTAEVFDPESGRATAIKIDGDSSQIGTAILKAIRKRPLVEIREIDPRKLAANSGLRPGYILIAVDGHPVESGFELPIHREHGTSYAEITVLKPGPSLFKTHLRLRSEKNVPTDLGMTCWTYSGLQDRVPVSARKVLLVFQSAARHAWGQWSSARWSFPLDSTFPAVNGANLCLAILAGTLTLTFVPLAVVGHEKHLRILQPCIALLTLARPDFAWVGLALIAIFLLQRGASGITRMVTAAVALSALHCSPLATGAFAGISFALVSSNLLPLQWYM
jgi:hypothetical protein